MASRLSIQPLRREEATLGASNLIVADLPEWKANRIDSYYWHWGSAGLFLLEGPEGTNRRKWNEAVKNALVPNQHPGKDGCKAGSWDPENDRWGADGGRVGQTALSVLTLETSYRYPLPPAKPKK